MIWFILVSVVSGSPKVQVFADQAQACVAYGTEQPNSPKVYQVENKSKGPVLTEGDCRPVIEFKTK